MFLLYFIYSVTIFSWIAVLKYCPAISRTVTKYKRKMQYSHFLTFPPLKWLFFFLPCLSSEQPSCWWVAVSIWQLCCAWAAVEYKPWFYPPDPDAQNSPLRTASSDRSAQSGKRRFPLKTNRCQQINKTMMNEPPNKRGCWTSAYLCECGDGPFGLPQRAQTGTVRGLQHLLRLLLLTHQLLRSSAVHFTPVKTNSESFVFLLLCSRSFLITFDFSFQQNHLMLYRTEGRKKRRGRRKMLCLFNSIS